MLRSDGYTLVDLIKSTVVKIIIRIIECIFVLKWTHIMHKVESVIEKSNLLFLFSFRPDDQVALL